MNKNSNKRTKKFYYKLEIIAEFEKLVEAKKN
jgi:hypothetical protein